MKQTLLILTIILGTALAACGGNTASQDSPHSGPADYQDLENRVRRLETREALTGSEARATRQVAPPEAVIDESTDLLDMIPSTATMVFAVDLAAVREKAEGLPFHYGRFNGKLKNTFEFRLNTEEITAESTNRLIYAASYSYDNGLILLQGNLHPEDIRWQWQEDEYDRRTYRGHEIWRGE